jgi:hypothetical protein
LIVAFAAMCDAPMASSAMPPTTITGTAASNNIAAQ